MSAFVASKSAGSTNGTSVTVSGIDTLAADLIVVIIHSYPINVTKPTLVDITKGNSYTEISTRTNSTTARTTMYFYTGTGIGDASHSFSAGVGSSDTTYPTIHVLAFSGMIASQGTIQEVGGTGLTAGSAGSVTPTENNCVIVAAINTYNSTSGVPIDINLGFANPVSINSNYYFLTLQHIGGAASYLIQGTAASISPTWTSNCGNHSRIMAVFKPATSTGDTPSFLFNFL